MNILLFATAYNGLCQRVDRELLRAGHRVWIELSAEPDTMSQTVAEVSPDLILCPFLKHRVPESIWREYPCLIVHPGIEGDRGPSSIDWAIHQKLPHWGVTLLQADAEMDAGDIWGTEVFPTRETTKGSLYRREVVAAASRLVHRALEQMNRPDFVPRPLDYDRPEVLGRWQPCMRQTDRAIDWRRDDTDTIVRRIRAADGFPGVRDEIEGVAFYLYGAQRGDPCPGAEPGELVGHHEGAVCRATRDGSVWIRQMKQAPVGEQRFIKLPALWSLGESPLAERVGQLPVRARDKPSDIRVEVGEGIAYVHFDFYNGAMSTYQCRALLAELRRLRADPSVHMQVLLGGEDFWSNGIHLNCIEAAMDPARESWLNINAMDDLARTVLENTEQITVAALRNNAGAGGAVLAAACDRVMARSGVVLNAHYQTMGLYGSEYWTYVLPGRMGRRAAHEMLEQCEPLLADEALELGLVDEVLPEQWGEYHTLLAERCRALVEPESLDKWLHDKRRRREADEAHCPLSAYRARELERMKAIFDDPDSDYHRLRYNFVHKISCGRTPERLRRPRQTGHTVEIA